MHAVDALKHQLL